MKIRTKLFLYNIIIVGVSAILALVVALLINWSTSNTLYDIRSVTVDKNVNNVIDILDKSKSSQITNIKLYQYGYSLYIFDKEQQVYGSSDNQLADFMRQYHFATTEPNILLVDGKTIVAEHIDDKKYFAVQEETFESQSPQARGFNPRSQVLGMTILFIIMTLCIIVIISIVLSEKILHHVMKPLGILQAGADNIEQGNYHTELTYERQDEFLPVIENFNQMQKSLDQKTKKTKEYERARLSMINGVSHDLRTPLTVIKGNIKAINDGVINDQEKQKEYLKVAYKRAEDIEKMLNKFFSTFNLENKNLQLNLELTDLNEFITQNIDPEIETNLEKNLPKVLLDKIEFKRVLDNLIQNSKKHNQGQDNLRISITTTTENDKIKIIFKDNGKGVKAKNLEKIFDEFYKEDDSRGRDKAGSGLGLFIVKNVIEAHGGKITAKNNKGLEYNIYMEQANEDINS